MQASNLESKDVSPTLPGEAQVCFLFDGLLLVFVGDLVLNIRLLLLQEATKILQSNHEEESSKQLADSEESSNPPLPTSDSNSVPDDL